MPPTKDEYTLRCRSFLVAPLPRIEQTYLDLHQGPSSITSPTAFAKMYDLVIIRSALVLQWADSARRAPIYCHWLNSMLFDPLFLIVIYCLK